MEEKVLQDPFDYGAEDKLIAAYREAIGKVGEPEWNGEAPDYGLAYSGPGGRERTNKDFA